LAETENSIYKLLSIDEVIFKGEELNAPPVATQIVLLLDKGVPDVFAATAGTLPCVGQTPDPVNWFR
jgi:hypothetical protein